MRNIKLILSYDGTNYHGWQRQPNVETVAGKLEHTLEIFLGKPHRIIGASRTDRGVHALYQVANFSTNSTMAIPDMLHALRSLLPNDIWVHSLEEVEMTFNARWCAKVRHYQYVILNSINYIPQLSRYSFWYPEKIDVDRLRQLCTIFVGEHNFEAFTLPHHKGCRIRKVYSMNVYKEDINFFGGAFVILEIAANSFLPRMVRSIVGVLLGMLRGNVCVDEVKEALCGNSRSNFIRSCAPPQALYLKKIDY